MSDKLTVQFDEKRIDAIFAKFDQCHLPGAAVGIAIRGKPVYRKGFGLANMELPVVLSPTIRMRIASVTKHFVAFTYMLLCEDGKAGIDDPVGKYFPELHPIARKVTMRQLMGNIGGLRDALDIFWTFVGRGRRISTDEIVSLHRDIDDVNAAPGTAWIYSNGGWEILSVAIERITGRSLEEVLRQRVFEPIGMYQSMLRRVDHDFVPNSAMGHMVNPAGQYEKRDEWNLFATPIAGAGGIVSTVDDMLLWLASMDEQKIGSAAIWKAMKAPQRLTNGTSTSYGFGLATGQYRGVDTIFHLGGGSGGNAQMLKVPNAGLDIVCMVNRRDASAYLLVNQILDVCLPSLDPVKTASSSVCASGIFHSPTTGRVIQFRTLVNKNTAFWIKEEARDQCIVSIDGFDSEFAPDDDGVLRRVGFRYGPQEVTLIGDRTKPASIHFSDYGNLDELIAVLPGKNTDVAAITGRYRFASTNIDATISDSDDGPRMHTVSRFGSTVHTLEHLAGHIWWSPPPVGVSYGGILSFDGDGTRFRYSNLFNRSLPFRRVG